MNNIKQEHVKRNPENRISIVETKSGSTSLANEIQISFFANFCQEITLNLPNVR